VVVDCQASGREPYFTETPLLIAEVLSENSRAVDEREKRLAYQAIEPLREYLPLDQDRPEARIYRRINAGQDWSLEDAGEGNTVQLESIELILPIAEIYAGAWR
jgi:Uma2 family endonuclease